MITKSHFLALPKFLGSSLSPLPQNWTSYSSTPLEVEQFLSEMQRDALSTNSGSLTMALVLLTWIVSGLSELGGFGELLKLPNPDSRTSGVE